MSTKPRKGSKSPARKTFEQLTIDAYGFECMGSENRKCRYHLKSYDHATAHALRTGHSFVYVIRMVPIP